MSVGAALAARLARCWDGARWYLRECSGEARWDRYLLHCTEHGHVPVTRREFELARAAAAERTGVIRCC